MPTASRTPCGWGLCHYCIMAHGSNVGPETMSKLIQAATYRQIHYRLAISWRKPALYPLLSMPLRLWTPHRGEGKTSASDNGSLSTVLHQTYSPKFSVPLNSTRLSLTTTPHFIAPQLNALNETLLMFWMDCSTKWPTVGGTLYRYTWLHRNQLCSLYHAWKAILSSHTWDSQRIYRIDPEKDYGILQDKS